MLNKTYSEFDPTSEMDSAQFEQVMQRIKNAAGAQKDSEFAKFLGVHPQSVTNARTKKKIPYQWYFIVGLKTNCSVDWLVDGRGPTKRSLAPEESVNLERCLSPEEFLFVPLLEGWVAAGPAGEIIYGEIADHYPFKRWWIERLVGKRPERLKDLFLIKVRGTSMSPTINQGEVILVDTHEAGRLEIRTGQIYIVVQPDSSVVVKRLAFSERAGSMRLICMSDNVVEYKPFDFELEPGKSILEYVLGRVRWAGKEFD